MIGSQNYTHKVETLKLRNPNFAINKKSEIVHSVTVMLVQGILSMAACPLHAETLFLVLLYRFPLLLSCCIISFLFSLRV